MSSLVLQIAAEVVGHASREHPADVVLRDALASRRLPTSEETREISRAVFSYFRWWNWLERESPLTAQIQAALELARTFAERPQSFSDETLVERAVPPWVQAELSLSPAWVRAIQAEPKLWLRARRGQGLILSEKLGTTWKSPLPDAVLYLGLEDLFRRPEFHAGEFEIQDLNSQAVGFLCSPQPGQTWWDACAGQGGKTLQLSGLMENKGLIWASDRSASRLQQLKRRAARAQVFNFRSALWDGGAKLPTKTKFHGILLDAPCSGLGTWQRNPHARWTTTPQDVQELASIQLKLLNHAAPALRPGGKLVYSVCTLTGAETSGVVDQFSRAHPELKPLELPDIFGTAGAPTAPTLPATRTLWPQDHRGNGMFIAAWRRAD